MENDAPAPEPKDKILDLDELVEPAGTFRLQGVVYDYKEFGTLGLIEQHEVDKLWKHVQEIKQKKKITKTDEETHERLIRKLIPLISSMDKEITKKMPLPKLIQACVCFFSFRTASQVALVVRMMEVAGKSDLLNQSIGETLSPDSTASTLRETP